MKIEAVFGHNGTPLARAHCDGCADTIECHARHARTNGEKSVDRVSSVIRSLSRHGWAEVRRKLLCAKCMGKSDQKEAKKDVTDMNENRAEEIGNQDSPRQPTREQKRNIMAMLEVAYDVKAGTYLGTDTDKTVADSIGGGVMFGWVAQIREEFFGPNGGNEEINDLKASYEAMHKDTMDVIAKVHNLRIGLTEAEKSLQSFRERAAAAASRLDAIARAVGPKAGRL